MIDKWDLNEIVSFLENNTNQIDSIVNACEEYLNKKGEFIPILKRLIEIKKTYQKGLKFTNHIRKPNYFLSNIETITECYKKQIWTEQQTKEAIEFEKEHMNNRKTVYRFKKRLLKAGVPQNLI